ncbi:MAG: hypothetical protein SOW25_01480 [Helicobacter sp.]|nr:hypothetical protein [Helicobacteraceae bacterium]MDY3112982.1 hypothetical protein [Helicobacter sp.]
MRIEKLDENNYILHGKMKEISDYDDIKTLLEKFKPNSSEQNPAQITFTIPRSKDISYYILGYLLKLARKNHFKFELHIGNPYLYESLLRLGLHQFFKVYNDSMEYYL